MESNRATSPKALEIQVLGPFSATCGSVRRDRFPTRKCRDLLTLLALRVGTPIRRDVLLRSLWPEDADAASRNRLSVTHYLLRKSFADEREAFDAALTATRDSLRLEEQHCRIDLHELLDLSRAGDDRLAEAVGLYRGPALLDIDGEWAEPHRLEAADAFASSSVRLAELQELSGDVRTALRTLEHAQSLEPADTRLAKAILDWHERHDGDVDGVARRLAVAARAAGKPVPAPAATLLANGNGNGVVPHPSESNLAVGTILMTSSALEIEPTHGDERLSGNCMVFLDPTRAVRLAEEWIRERPSESAILHTCARAYSEAAPDWLEPMTLDLLEGQLACTRVTASLVRQHRWRTLTTLGRSRRLFLLEPW